MRKKIPTYVRMTRSHSIIISLYRFAFAIVRFIVLLYFFMLMSTYTLIKTTWSLLIGNFGKVSIVTLLVLIVSLISYGSDIHTTKLQEHMALSYDETVLQPLDLSRETLNMMIHPTQLTAIQSATIARLKNDLILKAIWTLLAIQIGMIILWSLVNLSEIAMALRLSSNEQDSTPLPTTISSWWSRLLTYWWTSIVMMIAVMLWLIVFILPGIWILCRLILANYLIIKYPHMGVWTAINESWTLTRGHGWMIFKTLILVSLMQILGILALWVGLLWTYPMTWMIWGVLLAQLDHDTLSPETA